MKFNIRNWFALLALLVWISFTVSVLEGVRPEPNRLEVLGHGDGHGKNAKERKWAVLVSGSSGYRNYRHQANVCHAYQILKKGGLKDENIIVFMYDDIANHPLNPRPGTIINKPNGPNVYEGVPKDYTGDNATAKNLYAVISGNLSALSGGSGKVVDSGPNDTVFIYYVDHGATGILGMPAAEFVIAEDFMKVLKKKHAAKSYKKMVIYLEACESGSIFEGILPNDINIFATTASNPTENSFAYYCPDLYPSPPSEYTTCLGDTYSISWLEDRYLQKAPDNSEEKLKAQKMLDDEIAHREDVDKVIHLSGDLLFGEKKSSTIMFHVRPPGQPLVDDWNCFKTLIKTYESICGTLSTYGWKYTRAFANMCNAGISEEKLKTASSKACPKENHVS